MKLTSKLILALTAAVTVAGFASTASAEPGRWGRHHPRQHEVLHREHHQIARINRERREGEISGRQARALRASDRSIAMQDRADARANGGYITKSQQHQLNGEENAQSHAIGQ